jgi:RND family efflux transporter MFP subunit
MQRTKDFFTRAGEWIWQNKWKSIGIALFIFVILFFIFSPKQPKIPLVTEVAARGDLKATVLATGTVTSVTDLALSFSTTDTLRSLRVKVGDTVKQDAVLAMLDNRDELATLTSARGALAAAQAAKQKLIEGASNEEIRVAEVAVENAKADLEQTKREQEQLVANARRALLNSTLAANSVGSATSTTPVISGTYTGMTEGVYTVQIYNSGSGSRFNLTGLEQGGGVVSGTPQPLGTQGLFIQFPGTVYANESWTISIPNTQATNYSTNYNAYQASLQTQGSAVLAGEAVVKAREADLSLKRAAARPAEISLAEADILSAQGKVQTAQVAYENTILRAPADGTITAVDVKLGELVTAQKPVITVQDVSSVYIEANINESDITRVALGQKVMVTFDAFGPEQVFPATISSIDPSSTTVSGVVNYKIKATLDDSTQVLPGMTANMTITTGEKANVVFIPKAALRGENGSSFVYVMTDLKRNKYEKRPVTTGFLGDGNRLEVSAGVSAGDTIVISGVE